MCLKGKKRKRRDLDTLKWIFKPLKHKAGCMDSLMCSLSRQGWGCWPKGLYKRNFCCAPWFPWMTRCPIAQGAYIQIEDSGLLQVVLIKSFAVINVLSVSGEQRLPIFKECPYLRNVHFLFLQQAVLIQINSVNGWNSYSFLA